MEQLKIIKPLNPTYLLLLSLVFASCSLLTACRNVPTLVCDHSENVQAGQRYLKPLIEALEKYKTENGNYPEKLSQLAPRYLPAHAITEDERFKGDVSLPSEVSVGYVGLRPEEHHFSININFTKKKGCYMFKSGGCDYWSNNKSWDCY